MPRRGSSASEGLFGWLAVWRFRVVLGVSVFLWRVSGDVRAGVSCCGLPGGGKTQGPETPAWKVFDRRRFSRFLCFPKPALRNIARTREIPHLWHPTLSNSKVLKPSEEKHRHRRATPLFPNLRQI